MHTLGQEGRERAKRESEGIGKEGGRREVEKRRNSVQFRTPSPLSPLHIISMWGGMNCSEMMVSGRKKRKKKKKKKEEERKKKKKEEEEEERRRKNKNEERRSRRRRRLYKLMSECINDLLEISCWIVHINIKFIIQYQKRASCTTYSCIKHTAHEICARCSKCLSKRT